jgi:GAF domain-containing protein
VWADEEIIAVLDIDSEHLNTFDETDRLWLEQIVSLITASSQQS